MAHIPQPHIRSKQLTPIIISDMPYIEDDHLILSFILGDKDWGEGAVSNERLKIANDITIDGERIIDKHINLGSILLVDMRYSAEEELYILNDDDYTRNYQTAIIAAHKGYQGMFRIKSVKLSTREVSYLGHAGNITEAAVAFIRTFNDRGISEDEYLQLDYMNYTIFCATPKCKYIMASKILEGVSFAERQFEQIVCEYREMQD